MMMRETEASAVRTTAEIRLTPVQVDDLPGLSDLFAGELGMAFQGALEQVVGNAYDLRTPADQERTITIVFGFLPEADLRSASYKLKKLEVKTAAPHLPKPARMLFAEEEGTMKVALRNGVREGLPVGNDTTPTIATSILPDLSTLFGGYLDDAFRRELIRVLVNIDDRRAKSSHERTITLQLCFEPDDERTILRYSLKKIETRLAGTKAPDPATLFLEIDGNCLSAHVEPGGFFTNRDGEMHRGRQASIADEETAN